MSKRWIRWALALAMGLFMLQRAIAAGVLDGSFPKLHASEAAAGYFMLKLMGYPDIRAREVVVDSPECGIRRRLRPPMRALWPALLFFAATCVHAAGLNKCADAFGRVTYTSQTCEKEGLNPAGAIRDRVTVLPTAATRAAPKEPPKKEEQRPLPTVKPVNPLIDALTK